jgi:F1F0 ATPase subunit 2
MINDWIYLVKALVAGVIMGIVYFGGLWLTVQKLKKVSQPGLLALTSFIVRLVLFLFVLYFITDGYWAGIGIFLLGFFVVRTILIWRKRPINSKLANEGEFDGTQS